MEVRLSTSLSDKERKDLYDKILRRKLLLTALNLVRDGYNKYTANRDLPELRKKEKEYLEEYGFESLKDLKASFISTNGMMDDEDLAVKEIKKFLDTYEQTEKKLNTAELALRSKTFDKTYFKVKHPSAYYWLGVANFFAERALLEQESFIPFADLLARKGGGITTNWVAGKLGNANGIIPRTVREIIPDLTHCEPVEPLKYKYNAFNELANLAGLPAATGAFTSISNLMPDLIDYVFGINENEYVARVDQLRNLKESTEDLQEKEQIQYEIDRLQEDWASHHALNKSARLKKGEHKAKKFGSFIAYYRTLYMLGFFDYMEGTGFEGGWNMTNSFKSYLYKEDKFEQGK